jgi:hypothetical protein
MLRYGDGSPFPFDDAFLDLLADAVEACTTMLAATADLDHQRADAEAVLQAIGEEERQLLMFERAVAAACETAPSRETASGRDSTPAMRAAERTRSAMEQAVELSREHLKQISATKAALPSWDGTARQVHAAAGEFFTRRLLPGARWAWEWDVTGPAPHAEATAEDARFRVVFDLELPRAFGAPVRIDALVPDLIVHLPRRRWFRKPVETALPLGRCFLVAARHDDRGRELVIRKPDRSGWRIELPEDGQPSVTALDRRGRPAGTGLVRTDELAPLLDALDRELATPRLPRRAHTVLLDGAHVAELSDTTLAARALLDELGPTVRAIRQRSRTPGELSLKRDVADGVREELYVSRASLTAPYGDLPAEYRRLLDDAGFGRGLTTGIAELGAEPPPPERLARPSPAPRQRHETQPLVAATPAQPATPAPVAAPRQRAAKRPPRHTDDPTIPSIVIAPVARPPRAATPPLFPVRRLLTPVG